MRPLTNAEIARRLARVAQDLVAKDENPFKAQAYRKAAATVGHLHESVDHQVRTGRDLTRYPGIGKGIAAALREIVFSGGLGQLELFLSTEAPKVHRPGDVRRANRSPRKIAANASPTASADQMPKAPNPTRMPRK